MTRYELLCSLSRAPWWGLIALALAGSACSDPEEFDIDIDIDTEPRIVNGKLTAEWESVVAIRMIGPVNGTCSGVQITDELVLTAAHCVTYRDDDEVLQVIEPDGVQIYWGQNARFLYDGVPDPTMLGVRGAIEITISPEFGDSIFSGFDLALLTLDGPGFADPLPIRTEDERVPDGETVGIVGFGRYSRVNDDGSISLVRDLRKREGSTELMNGDELSTVPAIVTENFYGINGSHPLSNSCRGDSGGPVVTNLGGKPIVIGVASLGNSDCTVGSFYSRIDIAEQFVDERIDMVPFLGCVEVSDKGYNIVHFGYDNPAGWTVKRPWGPDNALLPAQENIPGHPNLPTHFAPGYHPDAFAIAVEPGEVVTWTLGDYTVASDGLTTPCP